MLKPVRFDLCNPAERDEFYNLFSAYLEEVCDDDEYLSSFVYKSVYC